MADESDAQLTDRERARVQRRDRRRSTAMVVDNAGVKRIQLALQRRRGQPSPPPPPADSER